MRIKQILLTLALLTFVGVPLAQAEPTAPADKTVKKVSPVTASKAAADAKKTATKAAADAKKTAETTSEKAESKKAKSPTGIQEKVNTVFGKINGWVATVFFWDVVFWDNDSKTNTKLPIVVLWLVVGAVFFTIRMGFVNFRMFGHAIALVRGKYDRPEDEGEVNHFQALSSALSATVGLGNIAGVAIAVGIGGPGATFWMILAGFFGMAAKFTECTLGQAYREVRPDGKVMGGAMFYLSNGLKDVAKSTGKAFLTPLGKVLAVSFAVMCIFGSFAGGNAFQVNQSLGVLKGTIPILDSHPWIYGLVMTGLVGIVIIGGIKRIAQVAEKIVPTMCIIYVLACLYILLSNAGDVPDAFSKIFSGAFTPEAGLGGIIGVLVVGFKRAAFSNEAGIGSAAIAHSAAKTEYPVQEGIVALLEPFIDTIVVCTMTALVIVITGAYANPEYAEFVKGNNGAALTAAAMKEEISWFPYILSVAVFLFAYSTMISWSYYGERCWSWMFGDNAGMSYRVIFLIFVFLGSIVTATNVLALGDLMMLGMAFPNILGLYFLGHKVKQMLDDYRAKLKSGEVKRTS